MFYIVRGTISFAVRILAADAKEALEAASEYLDGLVLPVGAFHETPISQDKDTAEWEVNVERIAQEDAQ